MSKITNWLPEPEDFENPTPSLIHRLQNNLQYYMEIGDETAITVFRRLLENAQKKLPMIIRSVDGRMIKEIQPTKIRTFRGFDEIEIDTTTREMSFVQPEPEPEPPRQPPLLMLRNVDLQPEYPEICTKECPHTQCSSWGKPEMQGKPCRNRVLPNTELPHPTARSLTESPYTLPDEPEEKSSEPPETQKGRLRSLTESW